MASMRPFLNTNNLFIKEITAGVSKQAVVSSLQAFCARTQGLVVVPVDYDSGATMGMAYMNFNCKEDCGLWGRVWGPSSRCARAASRHSPHHTLWAAAARMLGAARDGCPDRR